MRTVWLVLLAACLVVGGSWRIAPSSSAANPDPAPPPDVRGDVWAILEAKCLRCHNGREKKGNLDMSSRAAMLAGGDSGPALVVGDSEKSLMIELIDFDEMPPRKEKLRVTKAELDKLRAWIDAGADGRAKTHGRE